MWVDLIAHINVSFGHKSSEMWTNAKMTFVLAYSFKTPQVEITCNLLGLLYIQCYHITQHNLIHVN